MTEPNSLQALVAPECSEALEYSEVLALNDIGYYENTFSSCREQFVVFLVSLPKEIQNLSSSF